MSMKLFAPHATDVYKVGHRQMLPEGTEVIYSNFTPRSAKLFSVKGFDNRVVNFGLQGVLIWFLQDLWNESFFKQPKEKVIARYKRRMDGMLGAGVVPVDGFEALHDLGYLPVVIKALPEGALVDIKVPLFTIENTDLNFGWLVNYLETALSANLWKAVTTATIAWQYRKLLRSFAKQTGSPLDFVEWQGHDFSLRGVGTIYDGASNNGGHLLSFLGSDTIPAFDYLEDYYGGEGTFLGGSVPATEHMVMCMGTKADELETYRRLIKDNPTGIISIVSDTWDFWNVLNVTAPALKEEILARVPNEIGIAKVVFRPDSGDPVKVICGYKWAEWSEDISDRLDASDEGVEVFRKDGKYFIAEPDYDHYDGCVVQVRLGDEIREVEVKGAVEVLWDNFGGDTNEGGFKVLNQRVGLIYGDSITYQRAEAILQGLKDKGFASCNIVFGIGSFTYQYNTRDTFGHAMKATWGQVDSEGRELFKDPVTDNGTKKSAKGLLRVDKVDGHYVLTDQVTRQEEEGGELKTVFINGQVWNPQTVEEIRNRLKSNDE